MATTVIFDCAALDDAVSKASRIAPKKGDAFDKAAGIVFDIDTNNNFATIRATDLEINYEQRVKILEAKGSPTVWRIPSSILQGITSNLPMAEGAVVEFIDRDDPSVIRFKSGRMVAKLAVMKADDFPRIPSFEAEGMTPAQDLSQRVEQVAWATDPKSPLLGGIHMDGRRIIGCNSTTLAVVECPVALDEPVTVPLGTLTALLKTATDIRVRAEGNRFEMMLDSDTKASTRILEGLYPKVDGVMRPVSEFLGTVRIHRQQFQETLDRMMVMVQNEKSPSLALDFNGTGLINLLTFDMEITGTGRMQDSIDVSSDEWRDTFRIFVHPRMIQDAVTKIRGDYFELSFGHNNPDLAKKSSLRISDDKGYICYVSPKVPSTA